MKQNITYICHVITSIPPCLAGYLLKPLQTLISVGILPIPQNSMDKNFSAAKSFCRKKTMIYKGTVSCPQVYRIRSVENIWLLRTECTDLYYLRIF